MTKPTDYPTIALKDIQGLLTVAFHLCPESCPELELHLQVALEETALCIADITGTLRIARRTDKLSEDQTE